MSSLLIVDKDEAQRADVSDYLHSLGHTVRQARDLPAALAALAAHELDVIICPVSPGGGSVHALLRAARQISPQPAVILEADIDSLEEGTEAVRSGAFGLLQRPYSLPELNFQIKRALEAGGKRDEVSTARYRNVYQPYNFIGESAEIKRVFSIVNRVAATASSVIILGETGTGKELVAGAIHYNSPRAHGPFVRVNCAALPEQLLESELFGHEKGAFTGADRLRIGRFEHANGGTLFLDEVADMSLFTQAKVLRVVQEKEFERLGSNEPVRTDVRIISATNRDLAERMRRGRFREDLYYRLNVVSIRLPPLREREGDISLLIQFFLKKFAAQMGKRLRGIESAALRELTRYNWPGNIRELENTMERAVLLADGDTIRAADLPLFFSPEGPAAAAAAEAAVAPAGVSGGGPRVRLPAGGIALEEAERQLIVQALECSGWVQKDAARMLGLSSRALNYRVHHLGITHPGWRKNRKP
jgi:DNA-binding NtrC family response regulator